MSTLIDNIYSNIETNVTKIETIVFKSEIKKWDIPYNNDVKDIMRLIQTIKDELNALKLEIDFINLSMKLYG